MIEIPGLLASVTIEREGDPGRAWLRRLPGLADELLQRWNCVPAGPAMSGQVGLVLPVRCAEGVEAVLKVSFPHPGNVHEPDAYAAWQGRGAVLMYERADADFAMLLERAGGRTLADLADVERAIELAGAIAGRLAVPAPPDLPRLSEQAAGWEKELQQRNAAVPDYVSAAALAAIRELAYAQPETMVHGDLHLGNVLCAEREPWLAIDPKGYAGDLAHDAQIVLITSARSLLLESDLRKAVLRRCAKFADAAGLDRERTRRFVQAKVVTAVHHHRRAGSAQWIVQALGRIAESLV